MRTAAASGSGAGGEGPPVGCSTGMTWVDGLPPADDQTPLANVVRRLAAEGRPGVGRGPRLPGVARWNSYAKRAEADGR